MRYLITILFSLLLAQNIYAFQPIVLVSGSGSSSAAPISITDITSGSDATNRTSGDPYTIASITIHANQLVLLSFVMRNNVGVLPLAPTLGGTLSATWVQVNATTPVYGGRARVFIYRTMVGANQTGTITVDPAPTETHRSFVWSVSEFSNVDTGGTNGSAAVVQSGIAVDDTATATSATINLSAFADPDNRAYGVIHTFNIGVAEAITEGTNFTEINHTQLNDGGAISDLSDEWAESATDNSVDWSWSTGADNGSIALEIKHGS